MFADKGQYALVRVTTERSNYMAIRTTITGKGDGNRNNDDLAMALIFGLHAYQKLKAGAYQTPAALQFSA